jgi:hypothetical protein
LFVALTGFLSIAAAQDALLDDARARLARRDAAGAYAMLAEAEPRRAGEVDFDYLLGVAALDAGQVTRAVFALERAVARAPANALARAELGRAYLAAGDPDAAREQWRLARLGELPPEASAALERVIGLVDRIAPAAGPQMSGYVEVGLAYDSNVNSATNQGEFAIPAFGGILFQNAPEDRQRHDTVASAAGGMNAEAALSPSWALVGGANLRANVDRVVHDMDLVFLDATLGLRHTAGSQSQLLALQHKAWRASGRRSSMRRPRPACSRKGRVRSITASPSATPTAWWLASGRRTNSPARGRWAMAASTRCGSAPVRTAPPTWATMAAACGWGWSSAWAHRRPALPNGSTRRAATAAPSPSSTPADATARTT